MHRDFEMLQMALDYHKAINGGKAIRDVIEPETDETGETEHLCEWCGEEARGHVLYLYDGMWMCRECVIDKLKDTIKTLPQKSVYDFGKEYCKDERSGTGAA